MTRQIAVTLCLAASLAGCAMGGGGRERPERGSEEPEFVGRSLDVVAANGQTTVLRFRRDGVVTARFNDRETEGQWSLRPRELCFTWRQTFRECWPYTQRFRQGRPVQITSDRGNVVRVTMR
ncbi:MAG TPA: hypothetical protein VEZ20_16405 [Allosphingosinicella sp.]|jgi:hypothetical protein|nr:hypothetical protein [Allosphingosinicella sp.]